MKTILITGATGGLGQALASSYANKNTRLILTGRNTEKLTVIAKICENKGAMVITEALDICAQELFIEWISKIDSQYPVDLVIANAGINSTMAAKENATIAPDNFKITKKVFDTNTYGVLATISPLIKRMKQQQSGQIAIISSLAAYRGLPQSAAYCASKAAVISITQSAGLELIRKKINVNGIAPGVVDTPMWDKVDALFAKYEHRPIGEKKRLVGEAVPFGRMGTPEDHVGAAVFLASSDSDYVVAQTLNVDGGNWLS